MSQGFLGALDHLARVGLSEGDTEVLSSRFPEGLGLWVESFIVVGVAGESVHVADEAGQVFVCNIGLEAELVLQGNGECQDEVHGGASTIVSLWFGYRVSSSVPHTAFAEDQPCPLLPHVRRC